MKAYRICERKNEQLHTLFHPINGSRVMPIGIWMEAEVKPVRDASKTKGKEYISGFHCMETLQEMRDLKRMFKKPRDLVIVECEVEGVRRKKHSRHNVLLVDKMKLIRVVEKLEMSHVK